MEHRNILLTMILQNENEILLFFFVLKLKTLLVFCVLKLKILLVDNRYKSNVIRVCNNKNAILEYKESYSWMDTNKYQLKKIIAQ